MKHPAWLVFYGTQTAIVRARDGSAAFEAFRRGLEATGEADDDRVWSGTGWVRWGDYRRGRFGRLVPPTREEVTIRRPRESDRGWIEDSGDARFMALLSELVAS